MQAVGRTLVASSLVLVFAVAASAQGTSAELNGVVTHEGTPLPGVTITVSSPAMQGTRSTVSAVNGSYLFPALPPGDFTVTFEMAGMKTVRKRTHVALAASVHVGAAMILTPVMQEVEVVAAAPSVLETTEIQANFTSELVDDLPMNRTMQAVVALAPGVTGGDGQRIRISGSTYSDSLFLVNGAAVASNYGVQPESYFIEDAIQETTVLTGSISAEYGRFAGGIVSSITKSGGNDVSGSLRDSLTNAAWTSPSDYGEEKADSSTDHTFEATLGGRIVRDRLWYFLAGRYADVDGRAFYTGTTIGYLTKTTDQRSELKLTGQMTPKHSLVGSYLDYEVEDINLCGIGRLFCMEEAAVDPRRRLPRHLETGRYTGVLSGNLLMEAGYSARKLRFENSGSDHQTTDFNDPRDIALGTWGSDHGGTKGFWGAPAFCGVCSTPTESNDYYNVKTSYYLATARAGTHNVVVGYEHFSESSTYNNYQSGSSFGIYALTPAEREAEGTLRPVVAPGDEIWYFPIPVLSQGSDFLTESLFANNKWDLGAKWSFNVGVRYDRNDGTDSAGHPVSKDSSVSPRLGTIYDLRGDGRIRVNASYSTYVAKMWEGTAGAAGGGNPWVVAYEYLGPILGGAGTGLDSFDVLEQAFRWFLDQGGTSATELIVFARAPGVNVRVQDLLSPSVDEWTIGFGARLGQNGLVRIDYIDRIGHDYYAISTTPGDQVESPFAEGEYLDVLTTENTDTRRRKYRGVSVQASYRPVNRLTLGGNYTWSELTGNQDSDNTTQDLLAYPEYKAHSRAAPIGYLAADQTHKARFWVSWDRPIGQFGGLNLSLLQRLDSGTPYSAQSTALVRPYVMNPGYATPPARAPYYFSERGAYRWETRTSTDIAVNWEIAVRNASVFLQGELTNLFDEQAQINGDTSIQVAGKGLSAFNPFMETPRECPQGQADCTGYNWQKRATFGLPINTSSYQPPRTYRFSAGVRF